MFVACWDEPHCASTVEAATCSGRPSVSQAPRVTFIACMPTWPTHPPTTCPTSAGRTPARSRTARSTYPSSSTEWVVDSPPPRLPNGERTASTITTSGIGLPPSSGVHRCQRTRATSVLQLEDAADVAAGEEVGIPRTDLLQRVAGRDQLVELQASGPPQLEEP